MAVIVDTNVVVAGLLSAATGSPATRILNGMLSAEFAFVLSEPLLAEYRAVLVRAALRKLHGLKIAEVDSLLTDLAQHAIVLVPKPAFAPAPEPGDQLLWDLLAAKDELLLVTGDKLLLRDAAMQGRVMTPLSFVVDHLKKA